MLVDYSQTRLSEYARIYDILIPRDNIFRRMNEEIDYSFVRKELQDKYSADMGRSAEDPVRMFKYLMLKAMHPASDVDLVKRAYTDMSYKFFLGLNPEDDVIDPSLLSKFRRQRLQDIDLLDLLISKSVSMAIAKGIIKRKSDIIVDATHEFSGAYVYKPIEYMRKMCGQIFKACEPFFDDGFRQEDLPKFPSEGNVDIVKGYCQTLIQTLEDNGMAQVPAIGNKVNLLKEGLEDLESQRFVAFDKDAKFGCKSVGHSFFGYKAHIGMTPESIVVAAAVTSGEVSDGEFLLPLVEQAKQNAAVAAERKSQIGSGDRSERIRTYNFPQNRVTDHRLSGDNKNFNIDRILSGDLDELIDALGSADQAAKLAANSESGMRNAE